MYSHRSINWYIYIFLSETINFLRKLHKTNIFGMPPKILPYRIMYISPSNGHISLNFLPFKLILRFEVVFLYLEWECTALFERLMEIHLNPRILYYGFKVAVLSFKHERRLHVRPIIQCSFVPNAWSNQMSIKFASVPDCVFLPTGLACSLISSFQEVTATLNVTLCSTYQS